MGYFSNGSEGHDFEAQWCARCLHNGDGTTRPYCPVWNAHLLYNYDQNSKPDIGDVLGMLIVRRKDFVQECQLFVDATRYTEEQPDA